MNDTDPFKPPPVGSFPFFDEVVKLANIWTRMLTGQGRVMNEQWLKLKDGTYEPKDWYSALVKGTELTTSAMMEMFTQLTGDPTPPWKSLSWDSKDEVQVALRVSLGLDDVLTVSALSLLGDPSRVGVLPAIDAIRIDGNAQAIKLVLTNAGNDEIAVGQYIGFVMRSTSPEPVAIVTLNRPEPAAAVPRRK
jgi:hypothetical protein